MRWLTAFVLLAGACSSHSNAIGNEAKKAAPKSAFDLWDLNHDGVISQAEWSIVAAKAVSKIPERNRQQSMGYLEDNFRTIDRNHDGKITFDEYRGE
jgi:Ca2+-binding EF-hand superfamily protein